MDTQRLINAACQERLLDDEQLARAREEKGRLSQEGEELSLWEVVRRMGLVDEDQEEELNRKVETGGFYNVDLQGFRVISRLGSGGMGDIYVGRSDEGEEVAVKILPRRLADDEDHVARFRRESEMLARIDHPAVVAHRASGIARGRPYVVMELVRGPSLRERIRRDGALSQFEGLVLLRQMAGALEAINRAGIIHRDLKPANVLLCPTADDSDLPFEAKICDFGLAKRMLEDEPPGPGETPSGGVALGTPHYMSPEQAAGDEGVDFRSDMYSLAATVYHALMGRTLYSGKTSAVIMYKQVTERIDVEPLRDKDVDPGLIDLLRSMLAKDPDARPESWQAVIDRVDDLMPLSLAGLRPADVDIRKSDLLGKTSFGQADTSSHPLLSDLADRRRSAIRLVVVSVGALLLVAGAVLMLLPEGTGDADLRVVPGELGGALAKAEEALAARRADPSFRISLLPGDHPGPVVLGPEHSGLEIAAAGKGVRIVVGDRAEAAIECRPGCKDLTLQGLTLSAEGSRPLFLHPGSRVRTIDVEFLAGTEVLLRGNARLEDVDGEFHVPVRIRGAHFSAEGSRLRAAPAAIDAEAGTLELERCRVVAGDGAEVAVTLTRTTVTCQDVVVRAPTTEVAVRAANLTWLDLRRVVVEGGRSGLECIDSREGVLMGVRVRALETALVWRGPVSALTVEDLLLEAPTPVAGDAGVAYREQGEGPAIIDLPPPF